MDIKRTKSMFQDGLANTFRAVGFTNTLCLAYSRFTSFAF